MSQNLVLRQALVPTAFGGCEQGNLHTFRTPYYLLAADTFIEVNACTQTDIPMTGFFSELKLIRLAHARLPGVRTDDGVTLSVRGTHLNRPALAHDSMRPASRFDIARRIARGVRRDGALANVCVANAQAPASSYSQMGWTIAC